MDAHQVRVAYGMVEPVEETPVQEIAQVPDSVVSAVESLSRSLPESDFLRLAPLLVTERSWE